MPAAVFVVQVKQHCLHVPTRERLGVSSMVPTLELTTNLESVREFEPNN